MGRYDRDKMDFKKLFCGDGSFITARIDGPHDIAGIANILVRTRALISVYHTADRANMFSQDRPDPLLAVDEAMLGKAMAIVEREFLDGHARNDHDCSNAREAYQCMRGHSQAYSMTNGAFATNHGLKAGGWIGSNTTVVIHVRGLREITQQLHSAITEIIFGMFSMDLPVRNESYLSLSGWLTQAITGLNYILTMCDSTIGQPQGNWFTFTHLARRDVVDPKDHSAGTYEAYRYLMVE